MEKIRIVAIVGSLRQGSFNRQLALEAARVIGEEVEFELLDFSDVPLLNQDIEYPAPEAVVRVRKAVQLADGIWFFTPEYNHFFSGVLKNLIDWLSRPISADEPQVLRGKPAAISGITPGMSGTALAQDHLVTLISFLDMNVMNQPRLTVPSAAKLADEKGQLTFTDITPRLEKQAQAFLRFIKANRQQAT